ncbi:hypothetical protein FRB94_008319 [Tulasnella sp. JGI-2019a]|nr:hypothetical protein FRB93_007013 [Tulasnella sp. JGI-2019a]KAG9011488.1 hypothetical protein FRB94_008319 [Tulasnella sp. JGI-2019a]KAG9033700.1 hypothetical protein FRB95_014489 [Tulasnella sp. JGI-2019a]
MNTTYPAPVEELSSQMVAYWVNYVNFLNPNGDISSPISQAVAGRLGMASWPLYGGGSGNMLQLHGGNLTIIQASTLRVLVPLDLLLCSNVDGHDLLSTPFHRTTSGQARSTT